MTVKHRTRLSVEQLGDRIVPATFTWGYQGPGLGDATDYRNWVEGNVPGGEEAITVPAGSGGIDARSLDILSELLIEEGWNNTWLTDGLIITRGSYIDDATFDMLGDVDFQGGSTFGNVLFRIPLGPETQQADPRVLTEDTVVLAGKRFDSEVSVVHSSPWTFTLRREANVRVREGTSFTNEGRFVFQEKNDVFGSGSFVNAATGTVKVEKDLNIFMVYVENRGRIETTGLSDVASLKFTGARWVPVVGNVSVASNGGTWVL